MIEFHTFEDVLDFAILQEKAAQQFYTDLTQKVLDVHVRSLYEELIQQEQQHERKLLEMKQYEYNMKEPDLQALQNCGYLDAMPVSPEITLDEAIRYAVKKEKSASILYRTLAQIVERQELADLFNQLAEQEQAHADFFKTKDQKKSDQSEH